MVEKCDCGKDGDYYINDGYGIKLVCVECRSKWTGEEIEMAPRENHEFAVRRGWYDPPKSTIEALALIASEVFEGIEAVRNRIPRGERHWIGEELADVVLRVLDLCGYMNINLNYEMEKKHAINKKRSWRHGKTC